MKTFIRGIKITAVILLLCVYGAFLFVLPQKIDLNQYRAQLENLVLENTGIKAECGNIKLVTTPFLGIGFKAENLQMLLPDNSLLFSAESVKANVSLPNLLVLTVKLPEINVKNAYLNLEIEKDNKFKILKLAENLINEEKQKNIGKDKPKTKQPYICSLIRIYVPSVKFENTNIKISDGKTNHYLLLKSDNLKLGYYNAKRAKVKGDISLLSDENKNIDAKIDVETFLPKVEPSSDEEDDEVTRVEFDYANPVEVFRKYNLKTSLDTKLKIKKAGKKITSFGYLNIDNLSLNVENIHLPDSYLHAKTYSSNIDIDTNLNITANSAVNLLGKITYGKHKRIDMHIKTGKIYFQDILSFVHALLNSLNIKNELGLYSAKGYIEANSYIKTNFRKLQSDGQITVKDGSLNIQPFGNILSDFNSLILLNNNVLEIQNSALYAGGSKITFEGSVDNFSNADISVKTDKLFLPPLYDAFAPKDIKSLYSLRSGILKVNVFIRGKLKQAISNVDFQLDKLTFSDKKKTKFIIENKKTEGKLLADTEHLTAAVINENLKIFCPETKSGILLPKIEVTLSDDNINLAENTILINSNSSLKYAGSVINYNKPEKIAVTLDGELHTKDIIKLLGSKNERFFDHKGIIPVHSGINGDYKKQTLSVQALADADNYISPLIFGNLSGEKTLLQTVIDFKPHRVKIKKTGLYKITETVDDNGKKQEIQNEIMGVEGTVAGNMINVLKINIPQALTGNISLFPSSKFTLGQSRLFIFGKIANPRFKGSLNIKDLQIPELLTSLNDFHLKFNGQKSEIEMENLLLNGSDFDISTVFNTIPNSVFKIDELKISSNMLDLNKMLKITELTPKYFPPEPSKTSSDNSASPVELGKGTVNIKNFKTDNIKADNISMAMKMKNNKLAVNDISANAFDGNITGTVGVNLLNSGTDLDLRGKNVNVAKALYQSGGMKDTLSGIADFAVNLHLEGNSPEEQLRKLKGNISFVCKNGQYGPFGKIENLLIAENIRNSEFFQNALGGIISKLTTIDTTHYNELAGKLIFQDGICNIEEMTSSGNVLMLHIFGTFNLMNNDIDMKIRAKMTNLIAEILGPISAINPVRLMNSAASVNVVTAKAFSLFCETLSEEESSLIPSFPDEYVDFAANSNRFQLVAKGNASKPLTLIKSFKWITTKADFDKAAAFISSIPNPVAGKSSETLEEAIIENEKLEKEKKTVRYKIKNMFRKKDKSGE